MLVSTFISYIFKDFILTSEAYVKDLNLEEGEHREYFYHRDYANLNVKINEVKENNNVSFLIIIFASLGSICFIICNIVCIFYYCASLCRC